MISERSLPPVRQMFDEDQQEMQSGGASASGKGKLKGGVSQDAEQILTAYERRYAAFAAAHSHFGKAGENKPQRAVDPYIKDLQAQVIETFQKAALVIKACENCGAHTAPLRKDGYTKLFQKPMPKRLRASMAAKRMKTKVSLLLFACLSFDPLCALYLKSCSFVLVR